MPWGEESKAVDLSVEAAATETGIFESIYIPREEGGYVAKAIVRDENGKLIGDVESGTVRWHSSCTTGQYGAIT